MSTNTNRMTKINTLAPAACLAVLLAVMVAGGIDVRNPEGVADYQARVAQAIEQIPYRIGGAVGVDVEVPPAAVRLLKPNKLLQRRYTDHVTGQSLSLLVVHCGDVRDMQGHYPPACYPSHGWVQESTERATVRIDNASFPATVYRFVRTVNGQEVRMTILNFFVLPSREEQIVAEMDSLDRASQSFVMSGLGSAQVQIITDGYVPVEEVERISADFIRGVEPVVREIAGGVR